MRVEALPDPSLPAGGPGRADDGRFVLNDLKLSVAPRQSAPPDAAATSGSSCPARERILSLAEVQVFSGDQNVALRGEGEAVEHRLRRATPAARSTATPTAVFDADSTTHTAESRRPVVGG